MENSIPAPPPGTMAIAQPAAEQVVVATTPSGVPAVAVNVTPTQVRLPWRSALRTVFQAALALCTLAPFVFTDVYDSPDAYPAVVVQLLTVAGIVTRVMANPRVEEFLRRFLPFLAAAPAPDGGTADPGTQEPGTGV